MGMEPYAIMVSRSVPTTLVRVSDPTVRARATKVMRKIITMLKRRLGRYTKGGKLPWFACLSEGSASVFRLLDFSFFNVLRVVWRTEMRSIGGEC